MAKRDTDKPAIKNTVKKIGKDVVSFADNGMSCLVARHGDRGSPDDAATSDPLQLLTVDEAAAILRCSKASLDKWRLNGRGPAFIYVGRRVRYRRADLAAFIAASTRFSTSAGAAAQK
jgi:excisionase family DNA binding protein